MRTYFLALLSLAAFVNCGATPDTEEADLDVVREEPSLLETAVKKIKLAEPNCSGAATTDEDTDEEDPSTFSSPVRVPRTLTPPSRPQRNGKRMRDEGSTGCGSLSGTENLLNVDSESASNAPPSTPDSAFNHDIRLLQDEQHSNNVRGAVVKTALTGAFSTMKIQDRASQ